MSLQKDHFDDGSVLVSLDFLYNFNISFRAYYNTEFLFLFYRCKKLATLRIIRNYNNNIYVRQRDYLFKIHNNDEL